MYSLGIIGKHFKNKIQCKFSCLVMPKIGKGHDQGVYLTYTLVQYEILSPTYRGVKKLAKEA
jgi:hypothetical protein